MTKMSAPETITGWVLTSGEIHTATTAVAVMIIGAKGRTRLE